MKRHRSGYDKEYYEKNRERECAKQREYRERNKDKNRERQRKYRIEQYGISLMDYGCMLLLQDNSCALCFEVFGAERPHIDHDHKSGEVRGLLCRRCNQGLGQLQDDPAILARAIEYVR